MDPLERIAPYRKALAALVGPPLVVLAFAIGDGITSTEWVEIAFAALVPAGVVYATPNGSSTVAAPPARDPGDAT